MKKEELYPSYYGANNKEDLLDLYSNGLLSNCDSFESFCYGNVIKYVVRHNEKNGTNDLNKAKVYLEKIRDYYKDNEINNSDECHKISIKNKQEKFNSWYSNTLADEFDESNKIKEIIDNVIKVMYKKDQNIISEIIFRINSLINKEEG